MSQQALDDLLELYRWRTGVEDPRILDWTGTMRVHPRVTDAPSRDAHPDAPARNTVIYGPMGTSLGHPDGGVPIVVIERADAEARLAEARRVARDLVVLWAADGTVEAEWRCADRPRRPEVTVAVETRAEGGALEELVAGAGTLVAATGGAAELLFAVDHGVGRAAARNEVLRVARGELLVLVDERLQPRPGWLRALVRPLREQPDVGAVDGLVASDDGVVLGAGTVVFADGSHARFGERSLRLGDPLVEHEREVPFAAAGLLAVRTGLVRRLGGWDLLIGEHDLDADLGLRMRLAGRRSVHQPQALGVGDPTVPASDDPEAARELFVRRWRTLLPGLPARPAVLHAGAWARLLSETA